jgi:hypothetical protein
LWGGKVTREDLGIIASARAEMIYNGQHYPVTADNFTALANQGIAIIVIEKEGIADSLAPHAQDYGVALVHTQGRFTEYAKGLIEDAKKVGAIVAVLVDFDAVGVDIARKTITTTLKIGIDKSTVEWFQQNGFPDLTIEKLEEEYTPKIGTSDPYLQTHRIELDSIMQAVGSEAFWKYIMYRLQLKEFSPNGFNLNKVVKMPENKDIYPKAVQDLLSYLDIYQDTLLEDNRAEIEGQLEQYRELTNIEDVENELEEYHSDIVAEDKSETMQTIVTKITELMERLPKQENNKK